ncbi:MAG: ubiquitin-like small modifier protein 1 [Candidatus Bathyarchaeia archaeon]
MKISVWLFTTLRELAGKREETIEFSARTVTVNDVLEELVKRHGKEFKDYLYDKEKKVRGHLQFLVNGRSVSLLEDLETQLKEGDRLVIIPPVGGG